MMMNCHGSRILNDSHDKSSSLTTAPLSSSPHHERGLHNEDQRKQQPYYDHIAIDDQHCSTSSGKNTRISNSSSDYNQSKKKGKRLQQQVQGLETSVGSEEQHYPHHSYPHHRHIPPTASSSSRKIQSLVVCQTDYEVLCQHYQFVIPSAAAAADSTEDTSVVPLATDKRQDDKDHTTLLSISSRKTTKSSSSSSSWQQRVVQKYHHQLNKEYVLADFQHLPQIGLRWRTQMEVVQNKGKYSCGNKHCPSYHDHWNQNKKNENNHILLKSCSSTSSYCHPPTIDYHIDSKKTTTTTNEQEEDWIHFYHQKPLPINETEELQRLQYIPYGIWLQNYEVPFLYQDNHHVPHPKTLCSQQQPQKMILVQLCLCLRCTIYLFQSKSDLYPATSVRQSRSSVVSNQSTTTEATTSKKQKVMD